MKTFTWAFILLITGIFFVQSCKKHEVEKQEEPQYIVGEWQLEKITVSGIELGITDCHKQSFAIFESNGHAESKYYTEYQDGDCELHLWYKGTWEYKDDKFYFHVEETNDSQSPETEDKEVHFIDTEHFYFEENYQGYLGKFYFKKK